MLKLYNIMLAPGDGSNIKNKAMDTSISDISSQVVPTQHDQGS